MIMKWKVIPSMVPLRGYRALKTIISLPLSALPTVAFSLPFVSS